MAKQESKIIFRCQECGYISAKWLGKCPECNHWNTFLEETPLTVSRYVPSRPASLPVLLKEVNTADSQRILTHIGEFNRILGGGIMPASIILLGGEPGIGKSTLMLQVVCNLSDSLPVLYVSGEESLQQIKFRAERILSTKLNKLNNFFLLSETNLENIINAIEKFVPKIVVIDSIQTIFRTDVSTAPGSIAQVRECTSELLRVAKATGTVVFLLGHVTKQGDIAGPHVLEHLVDTVLYFESEKYNIYRILRAYKNRFGPTSEIGIFEMKSDGLHAVEDASLLFLSEKANLPGSATVAVLEGSRVLFLEIQALVNRTAFGIPRRMATGVDYNRVIVLIAVLEKYLKIPLQTQDIFINVAGGVKVREPAIDLGLCCAITSIYYNFVCPHKTIFIGEVGLSGELRRVSHISERIGEAERLGFERAIIPESNLRNLSYKGKITLKSATWIAEVVQYLRNNVCNRVV